LRWGMAEWSEISALPSGHLQKDDAIDDRDGPTHEGSSSKVMIHVSFEGPSRTDATMVSGLMAW